MIIPSIDLMEGKAVQLRRGMEKVLERDFGEMLDEFALARELQVIDLDAAMGTGSNMELVKRACAVSNARVGGVINSIAKAVEIIGAGAGKVIIGSRAEKEFLGGLCGEIGREKIAVALDSYNGEIVKDAWKTRTGIRVGEKISLLEDYCSEFFFTFVEREGMLQGIDVQRAIELKKLTRNRVVVAGGISTEQEAGELDANGIDCVVGMALYTGKISMPKIDFGKADGLVPAIAQDAKTNEVLMLAYMNRQSFIETMRSGFATYWSRSRNELWKKGATSGNMQKVLEVKYDCDADALLLKVEQKGVACHTGMKSCFFRKWRY